MARVIRFQYKGQAINYYNKVRKSTNIKNCCLYSDGTQYIVEYVR